MALTGSFADTAPTAPLPIITPIRVTVLYSFSFTADLKKYSFTVEVV